MIDLKQAEGVTAKEPQPCTRLDCWLLGKMGRVQQEGFPLRELFAGHFVGPCCADSGSFSLKVVDVSMNLLLTSFPVSGYNFI